MNLNILTQKEFDTEIRQILKEKSPITTLDAILLFCERKGLEVETAAALISPKMKATIEIEAMKLRTITMHSNAKLPINE
jgi:hypothetical protein